MTDNPYLRLLDADQIDRGDHRRMIGGMWGTVGRLQFDHLVAAGLGPEMRLVDVGCGALRGGVHFVAYLDPGNYFGLDINASLLRAGEIELDALGLRHRLPSRNLIADDRFDVGRFGTMFDMALAHSVFTHLPAGDVRQCLTQVAAHLVVGGCLYATFFECPVDVPTGDPVTHRPGGITTYPDANPYHYRIDQLARIADGLPLELEAAAEWGHPRAQRMARFRRVVA